MLLLPSSSPTLKLPSPCHTLPLSLCHLPAHHCHHCSHCCHCLPCRHLPTTLVAITPVAVAVALFIACHPCCQCHGPCHPCPLCCSAPSISIALAALALFDAALIIHHTAPQSSPPPPLLLPCPAPHPLLPSIVKMITVAAVPPSFMVDRCVILLPPLHHLPPPLH